MAPLVSIIIPVYNRVNYLPDCIRSVMEQQYRELEIILIDDGSTDGTVELCRQYAREDSRVRLIAAEHGGVSAARNRGLEAATGTYVFFLDSDDFIHPMLIETLVDSMEDTGTPIAGCWMYFLNYQEWDHVPRLIAESPDTAQVDLRSFEEALDDFFHNRSPLGTIGGTMMRRDLIGQTRFNTELFIGEDYYFIYENLIKGGSVVFLRSKWYIYRVHPDNSDKVHSFDAFWSRFYRRKLVWQNELAMGRTEYANIQKRNGFSVYLTATSRNLMPAADQKRMRAVIKQHKKELFPAFRPIGKIRYYLSVYFPFTQRLTKKLGKLLRGKS